jgi:MscS family membrane protein
MRRTKLSRWFVVLLPASIGILAGAAILSAQTPVPPTAPQQTAPAPTEEPSPESATPDSPRASLGAFLQAADSGRWQDAARYLLLTDEQRPRGAQLAERLKGVIDSRRLIDLEAVSGESGGLVDDKLPPTLEDVTASDAAATDVQLRMVKTSDAQGSFWAFSHNTVGSIDSWYRALPDRWIRDLFAGTRFDVLLRPGFFGVLWWHWIVLPILAFLAWGLGRGLRSMLGSAVRGLTKRTATSLDDALLGSIGPPLTLILGIALFATGAALIQITREAIQFVRVFTRPILVFAVFWALWRSVPVLVAWATTRSWAVSSPSARNMLSIASNIFRGVIVALGIIAVIAALGYPVTTVLAGLGIGGLALAFGAQKTVENVFGSVSLAVDQPFRIGDFVKVEDFVGTVEDIGLRSTRFRTLDRTVVSIPNGKLADQRLESFEVRDRMRLATTIGLTYDTTQSQMKTVLAGLERVLRTHPHIWPDAVVVKFKEFAASSLDIEIMAWFNVPTWGDFQVCRQEVLLGFMGVVEEAGAGFAFPTRTVHLVQENAAPGA